MDGDQRRAGHGQLMFSLLGKPAALDLTAVSLFIAKVLSVTAGSSVFAAEQKKHIAKSPQLQ